MHAEFSPRARYDDEGNIVLPGASQAERLERVSRKLHIDREEETVIRTGHTQEHVRSSLTTVIHSTIAESHAEWSQTVEDLRGGISSFKENMRQLPAALWSAWKAFWQKALTPIAVPSFFRRGKSTERSRGMLFLLDTIRFGGTFAGIFLVLFVVINGQSYWQIAKAKLALGDELTIERGLNAIVHANDVGSDDPLLEQPALSEDRTTFLSFLPRVGPPDNRLIIPKIAKNIPIVEPLIDALLKEDWRQFDVDIQTALLDGSVHYPGSARPGQAGNFFVTAHSSYYLGVKSDFKDAFARLPEMEVGDTYSVYYGGDLHTYRVIERKIVKPTNVSILDQPRSKRLSTLMTCYPIGTTISRIAIVGEEVDPDTGELLQVGERGTGEQLTPAKVEMLPI